MVNTHCNVFQHIPGHVEEGDEGGGEEYDGDEKGVESALYGVAADRDKDDVGCAGEDATEGLIQSHNFFLKSVKLKLISRDIFL